MDATPVSFLCLSPDEKARPEAEATSFRFGVKGTHTSRTIMLTDLETVLDATEPDAVRADYVSAIVASNRLSKTTAATAPAVVPLRPGEALPRAPMKAALQEAVGDRLNEAVLEKVRRNAASSWTQAGFLEGRMFKVRRRNRTHRPTKLLPTFSTSAPWRASAPRPTRLRRARTTLSSRRPGSWNRRSARSRWSEPPCAMLPKWRRGSSARRPSCWRRSSTALAC